MNKAVPTSDLFHVFLSFYSHKNNKKKITKMSFNQIQELVFISVSFVQKSSVRKRDGSSVGSFTFFITQTLNLS